MTEIVPQPAMREAVDSHEWERVEEFWLEALGKQPIPTLELLGIRRLMWKAGRKNQARTLLELLAETLEASNDAQGALAALRELIRLADTADPERVNRLLRAFSTVRRESPSLDAIIDHYAPAESRRPLEALETMETWLNHDVGTVVEVQGQGVGRVTEINLELENLKVDVGGRRPVSIPFGAVTRYVRVLAEGSFLHLKVEDQEALSTAVTNNPGGSLVHILEGMGDPADVASIKNALDGLLAPSGWTSWWTKARKNPRILSSGTGSRLRYFVTGSAEDAAEALLENIKSAGPRERLKAARNLGQRGQAEAAQAAELLTQGLDALIGNDPGLAWETADLLSSLPGGAEAATRCHSELAQSGLPLQVLLGIKERASRQGALEQFRKTRTEEWPEIWAEWLLHEKSSPMLDHIVRHLDQAGASDVLDAALETTFRNHLKHPAQFVWATEGMTEADAPEVLRRRLRPSLLEKIPDILSRREFADFRSRGKGLLEGGKAAIRLILEQASPQQANRFAQRLSRIDSVDPGSLRLVEQAVRQAKGSSEPEVEVILFVATGAAIKTKRTELRNLLEQEIPKTLKGINAAAAEGDLRENFEYHMLRDRQELLSAKAAKLQEDLGRVRMLEPGAADTSKINIGTVVCFDLDFGEPVKPLTILGAWDADLEKRIFANGTDLAKSLLGHKVGDTVTLEGTETQIATIEAWEG
ncbi:MAG: GreA/GreB family elongation factor [Acidobacteria bacterium]|nr:GreA/GreB family elongation factor [Acidobacteriota bacterium]